MNVFRVLREIILNSYMNVLRVLRGIILNSFNFKIRKVMIILGIFYFYIIRILFYIRR